MVSRWAALLAIGQLATTGYAQTAAQVSDVPSADEFMRRVFARTTVVGNYLYIDGGEVSQLVNGKNLTYRNSNPVNSTLSIDLTTSWKPSNVQLKETKKRSAPTMMRQAIFTDNSTNAIYIWGGFISYQNKLPDAQLWRFNPDGSGSGSWNTEIKPGHSSFVSLERSQGGIYVSTPDSGFYFGGYSQATSDPTPSGPVPGYLQFNFTDQTQAWTNHTDVPYSQYGTIAGGAAHYVPNYGPNGLVMLLGGGQYAVGGGAAADDVGLLAFDTLYFMDPVTKKWYTQRTSGNAPAPRQWHCVVGARGDQNTYEIFVFGGSNKDESYDEVWILSLPGFVWTKADYKSSSPRDAMGCAVGGRRQMITVGGINRSLTVSKFFQDKDPFPQGIGIFDMSDLQWKDEYEPEAATYETPEVVKDWYTAGNLAKVSYSSDEVAALFNGSNSNAGSDGGSGQSGSTSSNTGAIAGGVVGGVVVLAVAGIVAFCIMRRRKKQQAPSAADPVTAEAQPYAPQHAYSPVPASTTIAASELGGDRDYQSPPPSVPKMVQPPELSADTGLTNNPQESVSPFVFWDQGYTARASTQAMQSTDMEALAVATSAIALIDIIAKSYKTIEKINGLPKAFDEVKKDLPLVRKILQDLQRRLQTSARFAEDDEAYKVVCATVRDCNEKAKILKDIFAEFEGKCKEDQTAAKTWTRARAWYREALRGTKANRVEGLMKEILGHVKTLAMNEVFGLHDELENVTKALNELSVSANSTTQSSESITEIKSNRAHHYIPIRRNTRFVGRTEIVDRLREMLVQKESDRVALLGLGGVGKTQTALNLAYWVKDSLPDYSVFWVSALSHESFEQSYGEIAQQLGLAASGRQDSTKAVQRYLSSDEAGRWLLVVDNADDGDMFLGHDGIQTFLPQRDETLTLFTTRSPDVASEVTDGNVVKIPTMNEYEAKDLLHRLLNRPEPFDNNKIIEELLQELNYLPLAIQHAAAYLNRNVISVANYLSLMKRSEKDLVSLLSRSFSNNNGYGGSQVSVATTWLVSFDQIRKSDPPAAELLTFLSQIEPKAIPRSMLHGSDTEEKSVHAIGTLLGYSFITARDDDEMFDMHSLVHLAAGVWIKQQGNVRKAVDDALVQLNNVFSDLFKHGIRECLPHALRLLRTSEELGLDNKAACNLGSSKCVQGSIQKTTKWCYNRKCFLPYNTALSVNQRKHSLLLSTW
ncbi:kelch repeat protein [Colletotrichum truncatum]|uniref:Kelch repeat protein n=1 Tax=Colletotrichum truncatum TaxID=5467 RepID=A0ACC3YJD2_COLTU